MAGPSHSHNSPASLSLLVSNSLAPCVRGGDLDADRDLDLALRDLDLERDLDLDLPLPRWLLRSDCPRRDPLAPSSRPLPPSRSRDRVRDRRRPVPDTLRSSRPDRSRSRSRSRRSRLTLRRLCARSPDLDRDLDLLRVLRLTGDLDLDLEADLGDLDRDVEADLDRDRLRPRFLSASPPRPLLYPLDLLRCPASSLSPSPRFVLALPASSFSPSPRFVLALPASSSRGAAPLPLRCTSSALCPPCSPLTAAASPINGSGEAAGRASPFPAPLPSPSPPCPSTLAPSADTGPPPPAPAASAAGTAAAAGAAAAGAVRGGAGAGSEVRTLPTSTFSRLPSVMTTMSWPPCAPATTLATDQGPASMSPPLAIHTLHVATHSRGACGVCVCGMCDVCLCMWYPCVHMFSFWGPAAIQPTTNHPNTIYHQHSTNTTHTPTPHCPGNPHLAMCELRTALAPRARPSAPALAAHRGGCAICGGRGSTCSSRTRAVIVALLLIFLTV